MTIHTEQSGEAFVHWFRQTSPYIHAHRGKSFVIAFAGEAVAAPGFAELMHDVALLNALGIRIVLVHGIRTQIETRLEQLDHPSHYKQGLRITDDQALACAREAAGAVRVDIEALLSMGLANTPGLGNHIRVCTGNVVTARPLGVRDGIDYQHTGEVRRIDSEAITQWLDNNNIAIVSPIGYSPTGEVFNLSYEAVAASVAQALGADKLLLLSEQDIPRSSLDLSQMSPMEAEHWAAHLGEDYQDLARACTHAIRACRHGVARSHIIQRQHDGSLLQELFTRDGVGTLITEERYEQVRPADINDIGGLLELLQPLEQDGTLVRRSRERLEMEVEQFTVIERDGMIIACAALYPFPDDAMAELACLAVHPDYRGGQRGDVLHTRLQQQAHDMGLEQLFVLTTVTSQWFKERGYTEIAPDDLPMQRRELYNYQRRSKVFIKPTHAAEHP